MLLNRRYQNLFALFLAIVLLSGCITPAAAAKNNAVAQKNMVAEYQPRDKKGLGKILDWGLAKVERLYDGVKVADLLAAFVSRCDHLIQVMMHSFKDMILPYTTLHKKELERLDEFDGEFKDLVKLRNKIERKCMYSTNVEDRSACVDQGIDINSKILDLKKRRLRSIKAIDRYEGQVSLSLYESIKQKKNSQLSLFPLTCMLFNYKIEWCSSYNNWFC